MVLLLVPVEVDSLRAVCGGGGGGCCVWMPGLLTNTGDEVVEVVRP